MKNDLLRGTIILTITGFLTRIIGFFYKIYLSKELGAHILGIYQLIFPVYGICFTLFAAGIQTAISQMIAQNADHKSHSRVLTAGILLSEMIAIPFMLLLYNQNEWIAIHFLAEPACAPSLRILGMAFPFAGITACINGVYYGKKSASVPAYTQLIEQIARVFVVFLLAKTCEMAVLGLVVGEIVSCLFNVFSMLYRKEKPRKQRFVKIKNNKTLARLVTLSFPLTMTRLVMSLLHSVESILIPCMLKKHGMTQEAALAMYGVLTGMAMPFILFPSAITNSMSVLLLPTIAESSAQNKSSQIKRTTELTLQYSLLIGLLSAAVFLIFGSEIGKRIFHSRDAGYYLVLLAMICPFLYASTTLTSIINGLGKMHLTFFNTVAGLTIRIMFLLLSVPRYGINGYMIGLMVSQVVTFALDYIVVYKNTKIKFDWLGWLVKPISVLGASGFLIITLYNRFQSPRYAFLFLIMAGGVYCLIYAYYLYRWNIISFPKRKR